MFQLIVNANLKKLIMKGKGEEAIVSKMKCSCLLVKKHALERLYVTTYSFGKGTVEFLIGYSCAVRPGFWFAFHKNFALAACPWNTKLHYPPETIFL